MSALDTQIGGGHYKGMKIQPMEYSMANGLDACQHTAIKYISRFRDKGGIQDLEKAKHCIDMLIEFEQKRLGEKVIDVVVGDITEHGPVHDAICKKLFDPKEWTKHEGDKMPPPGVLYDVLFADSVEDFGYPEDFHITSWVWESPTQEHKWIVGYKVREAEARTETDPYGPRDVEGWYAWNGDETMRPAGKVDYVCRANSAGHFETTNADHLRWDHARIDDGGDIVKWRPAQ